MNKIVVNTIMVLSLAFQNPPLFAQNISTTPNTGATSPPVTMTPGSATPTAATPAGAIPSATTAAPNTDSPTECRNNSDCTNKQTCNFLKNTNDNTITISVTGVCAATCPQTPCSEEQPVCNLNLGGICTEHCASKDKFCPLGTVCQTTSGICVASIEVCATNEDCDDGLVCDKIMIDDSHTYVNEGFGLCTPKCSNSDSCKFGLTTAFRDSNKNICNSEGLCIPDCNNPNYSCLQDQYCDTKSGACKQSKVCEQNSDCAPEMVCNLMAKDGNQGTVSRGGVCEPRCPESKCIQSRPICDLRLGGLCVEDCTKNGYKCPTYDDGKQSLKCNTTEGSEKGVCFPESKTCTDDDDCAANELCDLLRINDQHTFSSVRPGFCVPKCNDTNTCSFNNNSPYRSPEKPKCNLDLGGLCQPDCALKKYVCPSCDRCNDSTGLCYNFTDDLIIVSFVKGANVLQSEFDQLNNSIRTMVSKDPQIKAAINKVIVTSSNINKYYPFADISALNQNNIYIYIVAQAEADKDILRAVEALLQPSTNLKKYNKHGDVILNDTVEVD